MSQSYEAEPEPISQTMRPKYSKDRAVMKDTKRRGQVKFQDKRPRRDVV